MTTRSLDFCQSPVGTGSACIQEFVRCTLNNVDVAGDIYVDDYLGLTVGNVPSENGSISLGSSILLQLSSKRKAQGEESGNILLGCASPSTRKDHNRFPSHDLSSWRSDDTTGNITMSSRDLVAGLHSH